MKVYIAKHYWKDGESATWESHAKVDKKIFEYLKKNYHNFVKDRPTMIKEGKYYIYLCYEDGVDIYDRKITNVTFFVSKYKVDEELCSKDYPDLEFSLSALPMKFLLEWFFVGIVVIGLIILGKFILDNKSTTNSSKTKKINSEKEEINIKISKEFQDINLSIKDINLTFITNKIRIINEIIEGKEKLLNDENNCSINKLRDFVSINKKIQELNKCVKNKEEIDKCKKYFFEIQREYKNKDLNNTYTQNRITLSRKLLNKYRKSLVEKKN